MADGNTKEPSPVAKYDGLEAIGESSPQRLPEVERLADKLRKASIIVHSRHTPHLIYRNTIEEKEDALREEVGLLTEKHILVITYAYGGFIPSNFQKVEVYTLDKFTRSFVQEQRKELLLQCLEGLE